LQLGGDAVFGDVFVEFAIEGVYLGHYFAIHYPPRGRPQTGANNITRAYHW
jgi:hypothetical protein